jgi:hypothetical protein
MRNAMISKSGRGIDIFVAQAQTWRALEQTSDNKAVSEGTRCLEGSTTCVNLLCACVNLAEDWPLDVRDTANRGPRLWGVFLLAGRPVPTWTLSMPAGR